MHRHYLRKAAIFSVRVLTDALILLIVPALFMTNRESVFYVQERLGFKGNLFKLIKFRTMYPDSDCILIDEYDIRNRDLWLDIHILMCMPISMMKGY